MRGYDAFAGVIKSGGKTRRAAKMVVLNVDHPDIKEYILCKAEEEKKAWALIDAGYDVRGWNRSTLPENLTAGIQLCQELSEAARADVCLLMLLNSTAVDAVLEQLTPHLKANQIILDMGSSDPAHSRKIARGWQPKVSAGWMRLSPVP